MDSAPMEALSPSESACSKPLFPMHIHVRTLTGQVLEQSVDPTLTVAALKEQLAQALRLDDSAAVQLAYLSHVLEDDTRSLESYGVREGASLDLTLRMHTGRRLQPPASPLGAAGPLRSLLDRLAQVLPEGAQNVQKMELSTDEHGRPALTLTLALPAAPGSSSSDAAATAAAATTANTSPGSPSSLSFSSASSTSSPSPSSSRSPSPVSPSALHSSEDVLRELARIELAHHTRGATSPSEAADGDEDREELVQGESSGAKRRRMLLQRLADLSREESKQQRVRAGENRRLASKMEELRAKMQKKRAQRASACIATATATATALPPATAAAPAAFASPAKTTTTPARPSSFSSKPSSAPAFSSCSSPRAPAPTAPRGNDYPGSREQATRFAGLRPGFMLSAKHRSSSTATHPSSTPANTTTLSVGRSGEKDTQAQSNNEKEGKNNSSKSNSSKSNSSKSETFGGLKRGFLQSGRKQG